MEIWNKVNEEKQEIGNRGTVKHIERSVRMSYAYIFVMRIKCVFRSIS